MSHMAAPRPSLKLPGMLDEPVGSLPLHLERPRLQPIARHLEERQKQREALIFCFLLTGVLHRFVQKSIIVHKYSNRWLMKPFKKCHKSGFIVSFMHFSSELLLLLSQPRLAYEATLWAYDRFLHDSGKPLDYEPSKPPTPRHIDVLMHGLRHLRFLIETCRLFWQNPAHYASQTEICRAVCLFYTNNL